MVSDTQRKCFKRALRSFGKEIVFSSKQLICPKQVFPIKPSCWSGNNVQVLHCFFLSFICWVCLYNKPKVETHDHCRLFLFGDLLLHITWVDDVVQPQLANNIVLFQFHFKLFRSSIPDLSVAFSILFLFFKKSLRPSWNAAFTVTSCESASGI